jgi:hypothetical protein
MSDILSSIHPYGIIFIALLLKLLRLLIWDKINL